MKQWLKITDWEWRHETLPLSIANDCDGWALVKRGNGGLISPERWPTAEEAAASLKPVDQQAGKQE